MKVLICSLNSQYIHSSLAPWCLAAGMEKWGHPSIKTEILEGTINQRPEDIRRKLKECCADMVGFCCYIWNITLVKQLTEQLKRDRPETIVVLGGPEAAFRADEILRDWPEVNYVQTGEGESTFAELANRLRIQADVEEIPGLCYRTPDGRRMIQPPYRLPEQPPSPYTARYFAALQGRIAYLETSRGCPFSCAFCLSGRDDPVRFLDLEQAKANMLLLAHSGARTIKLVDRTFNCHPGRAKALFAFLIQAEKEGEIPHGVCFHFEVAADLFDEATLELLAAAPKGLIQLEAGLQSFHRPTLEAVTRKTDLERLCSNLKKLLIPGNIHVHIDLIAGLPEESMEIFRDSFDKAYSLSPHMLQLGFLKLLHGSRLRAQANDFGYLYSDYPPYEIEATRWLGRKELKRLHSTEKALDRLYNSGRFRLTLEYVLKKTHMRPFDLFEGIGETWKRCGGIDGVSLDELTERVWAILSRYRGVDQSELRDAMACDILRSRRGGLLSQCLYREDRRLKKFKRAAAVLSEYQDADIQRNVLILESRKNEAVIAEYRDRDPVTGWYPLILIDTDQLERVL